MHNFTDINTDLCNAVETGLGHWTGLPHHTFRVSWVNNVMTHNSGLNNPKILLMPKRVKIAKISQEMSGKWQKGWTKQRFHPCPKL